MVPQLHGMQLTVLNMILEQRARGKFQEKASSPASVVRITYTSLYLRSRVVFIAWVPEETSTKVHLPFAFLNDIGNTNIFTRSV